MGPAHHRFWLPLTRLGAFFAAVVVVGNVVLFTFRPTAGDRSAGPDESVDYYGKKKKRLERQFYRTIEMFLGPASPPTVKEKVGTAPAIAPVAPLLCVVPATDAVPKAPPIAAPAPAAPAPAARNLGFLEPEPVPFVWPDPLPPIAPRALELPLPATLAEDLAFRAELVSDLCRRNAPDRAADLGDAILKGPEMLLDGFFGCVSGMGGRRPVRGWDDDDGRSITSMILDVQIGARKDRIWTEFVRQFTDREVRYLSNFSDSRVDTFGFQNRTEGADNYEVLLDQRKVFWDALRRTYLARYKIQADERIREDAWYLDRWSGADFVVLPPLVGAYVFFRGLDKKFTIAGTRLLLSIEPVSEWYRGSHRDLPAAIGFEWTMKDVPFGVIVSAGQHDGRLGMDFVGIGTSLGAARRALVMKQGDRLGESR